MLLFPFGICQSKPNATNNSKSRNKKIKRNKPVYIPIDLNDAIETLKKDLDSNSIVKIKECKTARDFIGMAHFGLGMGLRNSWGLWGGSRLAKWFNANGIFHPDDMSSVILEALWCNLTENTFSIEQRAKEFKAYWEGQKGPEVSKCPTCGADVEFTQMIGRRLSPVEYISYHRSTCSKHKDHEWIWDKNIKWRPFSDKEWSELENQ